MDFFYPFWFSAVLDNGFQFLNYINITLYLTCKIKCELITYLTYSFLNNYPSTSNNKATILRWSLNWKIAWKILETNVPQLFNMATWGVNMEYISHYLLTLQSRGMKLKKGYETKESQQHRILCAVTHPGSNPTKQSLSSVRSTSTWLIYLTTMSLKWVFNMICHRYPRK